MSKVIVNKKTYDSGDVKVHIQGVETEVAEISYNTERDFQVNYRVGSDEPSSWSRGKKSYSCTLTLLLHASAPIAKAAGGDLTDLKPFQVDVTYLNDFSNIINDTIWMTFTADGREVSGDMGLQYQHTMFVVSMDLHNA